MSQPSSVIGPNRSAEFAAAGVLLILAVNLSMTLFSQSLIPISPRLAAENGMLEIAQQIILGLSGVLFAIGFLAPTKTSPRLRSLMLVALVTTFLLREIDIPDGTTPAWLQYWLDDGGKIILLAALWVLCVLYVLQTRMRLIDLTSFFVDQVPKWLFAAALFLAVSWLLDREYVVMTNGLMFEEGAELVAYAFISLAAVECVIQ